MMASFTPMRLRSSQIDDLIRPFQNLLNLATSLCRNHRTFRLTDLFNFYYQKSSKLKRDERAWYHIAELYTQTLNGYASEHTDEIRTLCLFFLGTASAHVVEQSIKSMLRCVEINPFVLDVRDSYTDFLMNIGALRKVETYDVNTEAIFRAASIVLLLNQATFRETHVVNIVRYINTHRDVSFSAVFAQHIGEHVENGVYSVLIGDTPYIENEQFLRLVFDQFRNRALKIRPYTDWDDRYKFQAFHLKNVFSRISNNLRANKALMLLGGAFYPFENFGTDYIHSSLRNDSDIVRLLDERHKILNA